MKVFKIVENGKADARVFFENDKVYEFAAKELEKYVKLLTDCDLDGEKKIYIGSLGWIYSQTGKQFHVKHDGFVIDADEQALVLTGGEKRSALYAPALTRNNITFVFAHILVQQIGEHAAWLGGYTMHQRKIHLFERIFSDRP